MTELTVDGITSIRRRPPPPMLMLKDDDPRGWGACEGCWETADDAWHWSPDLDFCGDCWMAKGQPWRLDWCTHPGGAP